MLRKITRSLSSILLIAKIQGWIHLAQNRATCLPKRPRTRLWLEILEDRTVPATFNDYWYGTVSTDWSDPNNWRNDQGKPQQPDQNANVFFGASGTTSNPCTMNVSGGATVNSFSMGILYVTSTLTLKTSLTIKDNGDNQSVGFNLSGGNIAQPNGTASAITCNEELNWTSGTIGSQTGTASNLNLVSLVNPVIATIGGSGITEKLGDNLSIDQYSVVTVTGETNNNLVMANNANINNQGAMYLTPGCIGITNASGSNSTLTSGSDGKVYVKGGGNLGVVQCIPVVNQMGGGFFVGDTSADNIKLEIKQAGSQYGVSFYNLGGGATIYTGADLMADVGFTQQSGTLSVAGQTGKSAYLCYNPPTGNGNVIINAGNVGFSSSNMNLTVGVNFSMNEGTLLSPAEGKIPFIAGRAYNKA